MADQYKDLPEGVIAIPEDKEPKPIQNEEGKYTVDYVNQMLDEFHGKIGDRNFWGKPKETRQKVIDALFKVVWECEDMPAIQHKFDVFMNMYGQYQAAKMFGIMEQVVRRPE